MNARIKFPQGKAPVKINFRRRPPEFAPSVIAEMLAISSDGEAPTAPTAAGMFAALIRKAEDLVEQARTIPNGDFAAVWSHARDYFHSSHEGDYAADLLLELLDEEAAGRPNLGGGR